MLTLSLSPKGQLIILRCLVEKDRVLYNDPSNFKKNLLGKMKSTCHFSKTCENFGGYKEDPDDFHCIVRSLVSKDVPFEVFKHILLFL